MGLFSAAIGAVTGLGGAYLGYRGQREANRTNVDIANNTNAFSADQARINRDFQKEMSNTAMQRSVKDMEAAGLNPLLALPGGASSPGGNAASGAMTSVQNELSGVGASAMDGIRADKELKLAKAQIEQIGKQNNLLDAQTGLQGAQKTGQEIENRLKKSKQPKEETFERMWRVPRDVLRGVQGGAGGSSAKQPQTKALKAGKSIRKGVSQHGKEQLKRSEAYYGRQP